MQKTNQAFCYLNSLYRFVISLSNVGGTYAEMSFPCESFLRISVDEILYRGMLTYLTPSGREAGDMSKPSRGYIAISKFSIMSLLLYHLENIFQLSAPISKTYSFSGCATYKKGGGERTRSLRLGSRIRFHMLFGLTESECLLEAEILEILSDFGEKP